MKFRLVYTNRAAKDIASLDPQVRKKIKEALEKYSEAPTDHARKTVDSILGN